MLRYILNPHRKIIDKDINRFEPESNPGFTSVSM